LRSDRRARHVTARRAPGARAPGVLPSLHAARLSDRSSLYERHHRGRGHRRVGREPRSQRRGCWVRQAVFLDRDGTLIEESGYLDRLDRLVFYPYSVDAVRVLNRSGFAVVIVTNQAGIARGIVDEAFVGEAHRHISARLEGGGARVDAYYYCPHHPDGLDAALRLRCDCRKPQPGMLKQAAAD